MNRDIIDFQNKILSPHPVVNDDLGGNFTKDVLGQCPVCIIDNEASLNTPIFKDIKNKGYPIEFVLCLKNKDFYKIDFSGILQDHLRKTSCPHALAETIVTAAQEAYSNAFLWSSLDLAPSKEIRPFDFCDRIDERLKDPIYRDRLLGVYLARREEMIEVAFFVQGTPIYWPPNARQKDFRGTSIIANQTDKVQIDDDGNAIRLYFKIN